MNYLRSTVNDLLEYAAANIHTADKKLDAAMRLTHVVTYREGQVKVALAWHIIKPGKNKLLFHNGGTGGFRSDLAINPVKHFAIVVLSNSAIDMDGLSSALMTWLEEH